MEGTIIKIQDGVMLPLTNGGRLEIGHCASSYFKNKQSLALELIYPGSTGSLVQHPLIILLDNGIIFLLSPKQEQEKDKVIRTTLQAYSLLDLTRDLDKIENPSAEQKIALEALR